MFGQLVQTIQGLANLIKFGNLAQMCDRLAQARCSTDAESLALKEAIWALSHASTSRIGLKHVLELDSTLASKIIVLAKHCDVYSVRATAFQALGLIGSTKAGADLLYTLGKLYDLKFKNNELKSMYLIYQHFRLVMCASRSQYLLADLRTRGLADEAVNAGATHA